MILRRTVTVSSEDWSLDRRTVSKADIQSLLQSAGLSHSNPYFIVPQGRITALCNAKDAKRLDMLKEIAGTRVYEENRQDSLKILAETNAKRAQINELLVSIQERLGELTGERDALVAWQAVDRAKRACEHLLYTRERDDVQAAMEDVEKEFAEALKELEAQLPSSIVNKQPVQDSVAMYKQLCALRAELSALQVAYFLIITLITLFYNFVACLG